MVDGNLDKLLHQIASEQGFKDYKLQIKPISSDGANYSSTLYTAKVEDSKNILNLFIKVAAMSPEAIAEMGLSKEESFYAGEKNFYSDICKIFRDIEEKHKVPEDDRYILPKYYGASMETSKEMLVLEDLGVKGFTTYDRLKSIDWAYASAAVKELAKFHALSLAFEKEYPEIYGKLIDKYSFDFYNEGGFDKVYKGSSNMSLAAVRDENKEKFKNFLDNITLTEFMTVNRPGKIKTLIHTDFRPSNLMHRNRKDGTLQVIPVDYQSFQDGCPVCDLMYFTFAGSDEEFRRQHFDELMEHYYTELSSAMNRLGVDNSRYSREDFNQDLNEKLKYGLMMAAMVLPVVTVDPEEAPSMAESFSKITQIKTSKELVRRINGVVDDYIKWGIL